MNENNNENMKVYEYSRKVPESALKKITGGRLNGKSDINPMWRIKVLTEQFGMCGVGWKYTVTSTEMKDGANNETACFVNIDLKVKVNGEWSEAIPGTGGSMFVAAERGGLYTSDECYKMALTDALSVACKALGVAADVYYERDDSSKYAPTGREQNGGNNSGNGYGNNGNVVPMTQPPAKMGVQPPQQPTQAQPQGNNDYPFPDAPPPSQPPYTPPAAPQAAPPAANATGGRINENQSKRMYAISNGNTQLIKWAMGSYGYHGQRNEILIKDYEGICALIQQHAGQSQNIQ